jgi:hypothetical protein
VTTTETPRSLRSSKSEVYVVVGPAARVSLFHFICAESNRIEIRA